MNLSKIKTFLKQKNKSSNTSFITFSPMINFCLWALSFWSLYILLFLSFYPISALLYRVKKGDVFTIGNSYYVGSLTILFLTNFLRNFFILLFHISSKRKKRKASSQRQKSFIKEFSKALLSNKYNFTVGVISLCLYFLVLLNGIKINQNGITYKSFFQLFPKHYSFDSVQKINIGAYLNKKRHAFFHIYLSFDGNMVDIWKNAEHPCAKADDLIPMLDLIVKSNKSITIHCNFKSPLETLQQRRGGRLREDVALIYQWEKLHETVVH